MKTTNFFGSARTTHSLRVIAGSISIFLLSAGTACRDSFMPPPTSGALISPTMNDPSFVRAAREMSIAARTAAIADVEGKIVASAPAAERSKLQALLQADSKYQIVSSSDPGLNQLLLQWHALKNAEHEEGLKSESRERARTSPSTALLVLDASLSTETSAQIVRRLQPTRLDVIRVGSNATSGDIAAAVDFVQRMRADHGDDLLHEARATLSRASALPAGPVTGARKQTAERLLAKLRAAPVTHIPGLGETRSIRVRLGRVKAP